MRMYFRTVVAFNMLLLLVRERAEILLLGRMFQNRWDWQIFIFYFYFLFFILFFRIYILHTCNYRQRSGHAEEHCMYDWLM
jgi:hypothetical protein